MEGKVVRLGRIKAPPKLRILPKTTVWDRFLELKHEQDKIWQSILQKAEKQRQLREDAALIISQSRWVREDSLKARAESQKTIAMSRQVKFDALVG